MIVAPRRPSFTETRFAWAGFCAAALSWGCADGAMPVPYGTGGTPSTTSAAPTTTSTPGAMNDVAGEACPHTTDRFTFFVAGYEGGFGCNATTGKLTRSAVVTGVDSSFFELSTCPPGSTAGCPETLTLYVSAPDFTLPLILGAYVHLEATVAETDDPAAPICAQTLEVTNLPSYGGMANPVSTLPILWFAGADGTLATPPDAPFQVQEAQGCGADSRPGFVDEQLSFTLLAAGPSAGPSSASPPAVILPMGSLHALPAPGGGAWELRNLRSFRVVGAPFDDRPDFAYWIAYEEPSQQ